MNNEELFREIYLLIANVIAKMRYKFDGDEISRQTYEAEADKLIRISAAIMELRKGSQPNLD